MIDEYGNIFDGEFSNGVFEGFGQYHGAEGDFYIGQFAEGEYFGKGQLKYKNGDIYDGDFVSNMRCGEGILIFKDGKRYSGLFMDNKMNGLGVMFSSTEDEVGISGIWRQDELYECLINQDQEESSRSTLVHKNRETVNYAPSSENQRLKNDS